MSRKKISLIAALLLLCCIPVTAHAKELPQLVDGSIVFHVHYGDIDVDGGELLLYRVANIVENNGNYSFSLIPELEDNDIDVNDTSNPSVAKILAEEVKKTGTAHLSAAIKDGKADFPNVPHGLYVVVQESAAEGYELMDPFLISMPQFQDGTYKNDISVYPKVPIVTEPTKPTPTPTPTPTLPPDLPQTGQLNWPIPILAVVGLTMVILGFVLRNSRKKEHYAS